MPLNRSLLGRPYVAEPYEVTLVKVREFAAAIGDENPIHSDRDAALAAGHEHVVAPPTFPVVVALKARRALLDDPELGLRYGRVVHGEQRYELHRPVRVGDVLTPSAAIVSIDERGENELLRWREDLTTDDGETVSSAWGTVVSRGTAEGAQA